MTFTTTDIESAKKDFDWIQAFEYASRPDAVGGCDTSPILLDDVVHIEHMREGENDGLVLLRLKILR